ncbi:MAG: hypothetical protein J6Y02_20945 [Pseudobutyrivibrio sp.]|nr:hypothetical protein [Pseudobutyrivibrio sp.]
MARYIIDGEGDIMSISFPGKNYLIKSMTLVKNDDYAEKNWLKYWQSELKTREDAINFIKKHHFLNSLNSTHGLFRNLPESSIDGLVLAGKMEFMSASNYLEMCQTLITLLMEDT